MESTIPAETVAAATEVVVDASEVIVEATEAITEVVQTIDYTPYLVTLIEYANYCVAFLLFFVIVALCYFGYKFFRIFF